MEKTPDIEILFMFSTSAKLYMPGGRTFLERSFDLALKSAVMIGIFFVCTILSETVEFILLLAGFIPVLGNLFERLDLYPVVVGRAVIVFLSLIGEAW